MCTKKHILIFIAGMEAFHTLSHFILQFSGLLPIRIFGITATESFNLIAIIVNALITAGLLYWASLVKERKK